MLTVMMALLALTSFPGADGGVTPQTPRAQYEELLKQYDAPRREYVSGRLRDKSSDVAGRFLKFAGENPGDPASIDALGWVVTHTVFTPEAGMAMDNLARDHGKSAELAPICRELNRLYGGDFKPLESMLRKILSDSPHREVRGWACFALARRLKNKKENAERARVQHAAFLKGDNVPYVEKPALNEDDLERLSGEAKSLFEQVSEKYGDIKNGEGETLGEAAGRELSGLLSLAIGHEAPEIEGMDLDGRRFRLSDYRGKVVVLNFFSHRSCGVCRIQYPEHRALLERFEGKPFAMLGISSNDDLGELRNLKEQDQITWRTWFDGPADGGPIAERWNIHGWPMFYILDGKGVIRAKGSLLEGVIGRVVVELLGEIDQNQVNRGLSPK